MLEGRAAQEYTKELKKSQYFFQPVSDIETTITGAFHFHDAQMSYYWSVSDLHLWYESIFMCIHFLKP